MLIKINLLPWRTQQKKRQLIILITYIVSAIILSSMIIISVHFYLDFKLQQLNARLTKLSKQRHLKNKLTPQIKQDARNKEIFENALKLQAQQLIFIKTLLQQNNPQLCFTQITYFGKQINFQGKITSIHFLLTYLNKWSLKSYFQKIYINQLYTKDQLIFFDLHATQNDR